MNQENYNNIKNKIKQLEIKQAKIKYYILELNKLIEVVKKQEESKLDTVFHISNTNAYIFIYYNIDECELFIENKKIQSFPDSGTALKYYCDEFSIGV